MSDERHKLGSLIESLKDVFGGLSSIVHKSTQKLPIIDYADSAKSYTGPEYAKHKQIETEPDPENADHLILFISKSVKDARATLEQALHRLKLKALKQVHATADFYTVVVKKKDFEHAKFAVYPSSSSKPSSSKDKEPKKKESRILTGPEYAWYHYIDVESYEKEGKKDPDRVVLASSKKYKGAEERLLGFIKDLNLKPLEPVISGKSNYLVVVNKKEFDDSKITKDIEVGLKVKSAYSSGSSYVPVQKWVSAGGIVLGKDDFDRVYVRKPSNNFGPWSFPKGKVDGNESLMQAALREVEEEIGIKAKILPGGYLGSGVGGYSVTHFFVMMEESGDPTKHDKETEEVRLVTWKECLELFAGANNSRDIRVAMKAWEYARRAKKQKGEQP